MNTRKDTPIIHDSCLRVRLYQGGDGRRLHGHSYVGKPYADAQSHTSIPTSRNRPVTPNAPGQEETLSQTHKCPVPKSFCSGIPIPVAGPTSQFLCPKEFHPGIGPYLQEFHPGKILPRNSRRGEADEGEEVGGRSTPTYLRPRHVLGVGDFR